MSELIGIVRFAFHAGKVEDFKRLSAECMEIVRAKEPDTLQYDTFLTADESASVTIERFRDSEALIAHGANLAHLMEDILATGTVEGELLGTPSDELAALLQGDQPRLLSLYQSLK